MTAMRKTGLVLAAAATVAGALLALRATPLSLTASGCLLAAQRRRPGRAGPADADAPTASMPRRAARGLAIVSLVVLPAVWIVAPTERLSPGAMRLLLFAGIAAFVASSALFVLPRERRG